jgi:AhpD family alkylhydroperoxidase
MTTITHTPDRIRLKRAAKDPYRAMIELDASVKLDDPNLHELIKVRASYINGCAYCIDMHTKDARDLGESEGRLYALAAWRESTFFSDRERAALAVTDAITLLPDAGLPDDVYHEALEHFGEEQLGQLIMAIAVINAWNRIGVSTRMVPGE